MRRTDTAKDRHTLRSPTEGEGTSDSDFFADAKQGIPDTESPRWQFSLADVLLMIAVFAVLLAFLTRIPSRVWHAWLGLVSFGGLLAAFTFSPVSALLIRTATTPAGIEASRP